MADSGQYMYIIYIILYSFFKSKQEFTSTTAIF